MIRRPPRSTRVRSSAASDVYKRQVVVLLASPKLGAVKRTFLLCSKGTLSLCRVRGYPLTGKPGQDGEYPPQGCPAGRPGCPQAAQEKPGVRRTDDPDQQSAEGVSG